MDPETLYEALMMARVPIDSHESDLYVPMRPDTLQMVGAYGHSSARAFRDARTQELWLEVPFAFDPFWLARSSSVPS